MEHEHRRERDIRGGARQWSGRRHRNTSLGSDGGQPHARQPLRHPCGPRIDRLAPLHHAEAVAPLGEGVQLRRDFELLGGQVAPGGTAVKDDVAITDEPGTRWS